MKNFKLIRPFLLLSFILSLNVSVYGQLAISNVEIAHYPITQPAEPDPMDSTQTVAVSSSNEYNLKFCIHVSEISTDLFDEVRIMVDTVLGSGSVVDTSYNMNSVPQDQNFFTENNDVHIRIDNVTLTHSYFYQVFLYKNNVLKVSMIRQF